MSGSACQTSVPLCTVPMCPLQVAEGQLLATYRDEAAADLIQVGHSVVGLRLWPDGALEGMAGRWEWRFGWGPANYSTQMWPAYLVAQPCAVASLGVVPPPPPPVTYSPSHRVLSTPLQALAQARVEAAQLEFRVLELQVGVRAVRYGTVCCGVY
jgi:hypothetical protein